MDPQQLQTRERVKNIFRDCLRKRIDPLHAVEMIDKEIGGITDVSFKTNKKFSLYNHETIFPTGYNGGMNDKLKDFLFISYAFAGRGEIHLNEKVSTKHHKRGRNGFDEELDRTMRKYRMI